MKILFQKRQSGKTTKLIKLSEKTGYRIITVSETQAMLVKEQAKKAGYAIPEPMAFHKYKITHGVKDEAVIIDDLDCLLNDILYDALGTRAEIVAMGDEFIEYY